MCRKRTTGVVEETFKYADVVWSIVDVGGQRSERKKWIRCFDNVKAVLWLVNLAGHHTPPHIIAVSRLGGSCPPAVSHAA
jgi:hypothetical protein